MSDVAAREGIAIEDFGRRGTSPLPLNGCDSPGDFGASLDYLTIDLSTLLSYCARRKLPEEEPNVLFQVWRIDG